MSVSKGNYYRIKSKSWLERKGYTVAYLELYGRIFVNGKIIFTKKDLFASDLLAMKKDTPELIFVNSVFNTKNIAKHIKNFLAQPIPMNDVIKCWLLVWKERAHDPEIINIADVKEVEVNNQG